MEGIETKMSRMIDPSEVEDMLNDSDAWEAPAKAPRRKSEKRRRGTVISVRLSPEELTLVQAEASQAGVSISTFLRERALGSQRHGVECGADRFTAMRAVGLFQIESLLVRDVINATPQDPNEVGRLIRYGEAGPNVSADFALAGHTR